MRRSVDRMTAASSPAPLVGRVTFAPEVGAARYPFPLPPLQCRVATPESPRDLSAIAAEELRAHVDALAAAARAVLARIDDAGEDGGFLTEFDSEVDELRSALADAIGVPVAELTPVLPESEE